MCGISIIRRFDGGSISETCLTAMNKVLSHRGPDDQGVFTHGSTGLGHTRLSIIDRAHGQQPMSSADQRFTISYNGEIYNYQKLARQLLRLGHSFRTQSDTEIILKLHQVYGDKAINMLQGMFSYALYDKETQRLLLVRDRLGIKPLFYYRDQHCLVAGSEIKALFASGRVEPELDRQSIVDHFRYQFSMPGYTSFKNVSELLPGQWLSVAKDGTVRQGQYWDLHFPSDNEYENLNERYWQNQLDETLSETCRSHTVGDVPVGAYLSGGLDSSTTCFYLKRHYPETVNSFSIHFERPESDESYAYKPVARSLGLNNHELTVPEPAPDDFIRQLERCVYHLEQPQRMAVDIPHLLLSAQARQEGIPVVYTGDGADELFGGYDTYRQDAMREWGNLEQDLERRKKLYMEEYTRDFPQLHMQLLWDLHQPGHQDEVIRRFGTYPAWYDFWHIMRDENSHIWHPDLVSSFQQQDRMATLANLVRPQIEHLHPLNKSLYYETKTRLPNWILLKSDRLSMANGVEARVPFLDHRVAELCARIPPQFKLRGMEEKYLLKRLMGPRLPKVQGGYKKRGFYTPIREWFFQPGRDHGDYLSHASLSRSGIFNPPYVSQILKEIQSISGTLSPDAQYQLMRREWALMLVLTTQILYHQYVLKEAPLFHDI